MPRRAYFAPRGAAGDVHSCRRMILKTSYLETETVSDLQELGGPEGI
jgi:hypothetical protein